MLALLAQSSTGADAEPSIMAPVAAMFDSVVTIFSRGDALAQPDVVVAELQKIGVVWAIIFLIVGVLTLFNGYKFYKVATIAMAALLGVFLGYWLGTMIRAPFVVAGCTGLLLAVAAFPLMKYAVAVFGGLAGAFLGANMWSGLGHALASPDGTGPIPANSYWLGALIGLLVCGMLAFILFKLSIELFTSVSGSTIAVLGGLALLLSFEGLRPNIAEGVTASQMVVPLLVFVPAIIGLILQETWTDPAKAGGGK